MELTCTRCHRTVLKENCYCPTCGLPQLVFATEHIPEAEDSQKEEERVVVRDAGSVEWRVAARGVLLLAIPASLLCCGLSPLGELGVMWMATAAAWAVFLYTRRQQAPWITLGAGARIGLVTGIIAGWLAFAINGCTLFVQRFFLHEAAQMDSEYAGLFINAFQQRTQQSLAQMGQADAAQAQPIFAGMQAYLLSPAGRAGMWAGSLIVSSLFLLLFAVCGGAIGARMTYRHRT